MHKKVSMDFESLEACSVLGERKRVESKIKFSSLDPSFFRLENSFTLKIWKQAINWPHST